MSVLVRGMEMPKNCHECPLMFDGRVLNMAYPCVCFPKSMPLKPCDTDLRDGLCPLTEIPPHGRLVDADAFAEKNKVFMDCDFTHPCYGDTLEELFADAPTIIPAENAPQNSKNCGEKAEKGEQYDYNYSPCMAKGGVTE